MLRPGVPAVPLPVVFVTRLPAGQFQLAALPASLSLFALARVWPGVLLLPYVYALLPDVSFLPLALPCVSFPVLRGVSFPRLPVPCASWLPPDVVSLLPLFVSLIILYGVVPAIFLREPCALHPSCVARQP